MIFMYLHCLKLTIAKYDFYLFIECGSIIGCAICIPLPRAYNTYSQRSGSTRQINVRRQHGKFNPWRSLGGRGVISDFSWGWGGGGGQFGERSELNQLGGLGEGGTVSPPSRKFFYFELFYVLFEATWARYFSKNYILLLLFICLIITGS